jgi:P4 family phage/plasmid primase-like protien
MEVNVKENEINEGLPLAMQIARKVVEEHHVYLIKNEELNSSIPFYYDGKRYAEDSHWENIKVFIQKEISNAFVNQPAGSLYCVLDSERKKFRENIGFINTLSSNILKYIQALDHIRKLENDFDSDPYILNLKNGVFDIKKRELIPHDPSKLLKNISNAQYTPGSKPERFLTFIRECLADNTKDQAENDEAVESFLEILGSCLIGHNWDKKAYILVGKADTGKSTLLTVLQDLFGDYAINFNNSVLLASPRNSKTIRPEIIALKNKRLMVGSESNREEDFDTATVKAIAGNDRLSFRRPHKGTMLNFTITGKPLLATNFCPGFNDVEDQAFLNRLVIIDFTNIPQSINRHLKEEILEERDAIFTLLADMAYQVTINEKIMIAERFKANKQRILVNQENSVSQFFKEHIRTQTTIWPALYMQHNPISLIYNTMYIYFCRRKEIRSLTLEAFSKKFKEIADAYSCVSHHKGKDNNYYIGFSIVGENSNEYYSLIKRDLQMGFYNGNQYNYQDPIILVNTGLSSPPSEKTEGK